MSNSIVVNILTMVQFEIKGGVVIIPESTIVIPLTAFSKYQSLHSVTISESVRTMINVSLSHLWVFPILWLYLIWILHQTTTSGIIVADYL